MNTSTQPLPGGVEVKQDRSRVSTHKLLDAASELIVEVGYEKATLAAIAARAGYSHGLVTRRFGSKENMLFALVDRMTHTGLDPSALDSGDGPGVLAGYDVVISGYRRSQTAMKAMYILMFTSLTAVPALRERMADLHREFRRSIADSVRRAVAAGEYSAETNPEEIARAVTVGLRGCAYQWLLDPEDFDFVLAVSEQRAAMSERLNRLRLPARPEQGA